MLQTLLALYPPLQAFVARDRGPARPHFAAARDGSRVLLFMSTPAGP